MIHRKKGEKRGEEEGRGTERSEKTRRGGAKVLKNHAKASLASCPPAWLTWLADTPLYVTLYVVFTSAWTQKQMI